MKYNDVLTLAKAGFTAQQIGALMSVSNAEQNGNQTLVTPAPSNQQNPRVDYGVFNNPVQQTPAPTQESVYDPWKQQFDYLTQQMNGLTQALQLTNISNTQQPAPETTDSILASIINPPNLSVGGDSGDK